MRLQHRGWWISFSLDQFLEASSHGLCDMLLYSREFALVSYLAQSNRNCNDFLVWTRVVEQLSRNEVSERLG